MYQDFLEQCLSEKKEEKMEDLSCSGYDGSRLLLLVSLRYLLTFFFVASLLLFHFLYQRGSLNPESIMNEIDGLHFEIPQSRLSVSCFLPSLFYQNVFFSPVSFSHSRSGKTGINVFNLVSFQHHKGNSVLSAIMVGRADTINIESWIIH